MSKILVVIDMQNDFITGTLGSKEAQAIVPNVKAKIKEYADRGGKKLPVKHCVKGTDGWQIVPGLEIENCEYIDKPTFGWLNWDGFAEDDKIELIGVCTDICVVSNAIILKAKYPETVISVDADCCAGVTPEKHKAALETMKSCQIDVFEGKM